jgi:hypothetical protein
MNFLKLKNQFVFDDSSFETRTFLTHGKVSYHDVDFAADIKNMIFSVIPPLYHRFFGTFYLNGSGILAPHIDQTSKCTILFYNNPGDFKTQFYRPIRTTLKTSKSIPSAVNPDVRQLTEEEYWPSVYDYTDLEFIDSYVAEPNEAWVLNGEIIHSVEPLDNPSNHFRSAIGLETRNLSFSTVLALLKQTNSI